MPRKTDRPRCRWCGKAAHNNWDCTTYLRARLEEVQEALKLSANLLEAALAELARRDYYKDAKPYGVIRTRRESA